MRTSKAVSYAEIARHEQDERIEPHGQHAQNIIGVERDQADDIKTCTRKFDQWVNAVQPMVSFLADLQFCEFQLLHC